MYPTFEIPNVSTLSSEHLEHYIAAIFQANGYYVKCNLWWSENTVSDPNRSVDILQADILAYMFWPFNDNNILIECKGGGTFTDLVKFIGTKELIKPNSAFLVCNNSSVYDELVKLGNSNQITVIRPSDIMQKFAPSVIFTKINLAYWCQKLQTNLTEKDILISALGGNLSAKQKNAFSEIRKYNNFLNSRIWRTKDPRLQANLLVEHFAQNKGFVRKVLKLQGLPTSDTENAIANNVLCESAASVVLKARIDYLTIALRCAISNVLSSEEEYLATISDPSFKSVVDKMINNIQIACRLPQFLQFWIYHLGGVLDVSNTNEKSIIATYLNEREETIDMFFSFLNEIFSIILAGGNLNWGIHRRGDILEFNAIPDSVRGYGMFFRNEHSMKSTSFLYKTQWVQRLKVFYK